MSESSGLCLGCWRTIDEIVAWGSRSDDAKKQILALIQVRKDTAENVSTSASSSASTSISKFNTVDKTP